MMPLCLADLRQLAREMELIVSCLGARPRKRIGSGGASERDTRKTISHKGQIWGSAWDERGLSLGEGRCVEWRRHLPLGLLLKGVRSIPINVVVSIPNPYHACPIDNLLEVEPRRKGPQDWRIEATGTFDLTCAQTPYHTTPLPSRSVTTVLFVVCRLHSIAPATPIFHLDVCPPIISASASASSSAVHAIASATESPPLDPSSHSPHKTTHSTTCLRRRDNPVSRSA